MKLLTDGNFPFWLRTLLCIGGAATIFASIYLIEDKELMWLVACLGVVIGAVGFYTAQAAAFGVKPFLKTSEKITKD